MGSSQSVEDPVDWSKDVEQHPEANETTPNLDVSFAKDGSTTKNTLRKGQGSKTPREAAFVKLLIESATDTSSILAGFIGPTTLEFTSGNAEVCDAIEFVVPHMALGERAELRCNRPRLCEDEQLGLLDIQADEVVLTLEVLDIVNVEETSDIHEDAVINFAQARAEIGMKLQKEGRFAVGAQRHRAVIDMLRNELPRMTKTDNSRKASGLMHSARINEQACSAYWYLKQSGPGGAKRLKPGDAKVYVCQGVSCRGAGAKAVLAEIEELAESVGGCNIQSEHCLGRCNAGPMAMLVTADEHGKEHEIAFERVKAPLKSAEIVRQATGKTPVLDNKPEMLQRFVNRRVIGSALELGASGKWNSALNPLHHAEEIAENDELFEVVSQLADVLEYVGMHEPALDRIEWMLEMNPADVDMQFQRVGLLRKLGRQSEAIAEMEKINHGFSTVPFPVSPNYLKRAAAELELCKTQSEASPMAIEGYSLWTLDSIQPISKHSAVFEFSTLHDDRNVPMAGQLWTRTMLPAVGENDEGPMPWIERDYTPIEESSDEVQNSEETRITRCKFLIKIYSHGVATRWLNEIDVGRRIMISRPSVALVMPCLVPIDMMTVAPVPNSILFVVGGTGITPAIQACEFLKSGQQSVTLIYACRSDDMIFLERLQEYATERPAQTRIRIVVSDPVAQDFVPFPNATALGFDAAAASYPSLEFHHGRITAALLSASLIELDPGGLRTVVCGPQGMNDSVIVMLLAQGVERKHVTIMKA